MLFSYFRKRKQRFDEAAALKRTEELNQLQVSLGERAFTAIQQAASQNSVHSKEHLDAGAMCVSKMPQNGGRFSVFVYLSGINGWYGGRESTMYFALQLSVYASDNQLYALLGRYGPSEEDTLDNFDAFLARACDHVRNWRLYGEEEKAA